MTELEQLAKRLADVERQYIVLIEHQTAMDQEAAKVGLVDHAFRLAVRDLGQEIAAQHGISSELYLARFQKLVRWHHDELLQTSSDVDPGYVSALDTRTVEHIPTDDKAPLVLAPPSDTDLQN